MDDDIAAYLDAQVDKKPAPKEEATGTNPVLPKHSSRDGSRSRSPRRTSALAVDEERRSSRGERGERRSRSRSRGRRDRDSRRRSRSRDRDGRRRSRSRERGSRRRSRSRDRGHRSERDSKSDRSKNDAGASGAAEEEVPAGPPKTQFEISQEKEVARRQKEIDDLTKDQRTIFVGQLTMKVTETHLKTFFGQLGPVRGVIMVRDKITGKHKGFGYVEMGDLEVIPNCLLCNNIVPDFQKFPILVKASEAEKNFVAKKETPMYDNNSGNTSTSDARLYVGNLHVNATESELRGVLMQYGSVETVSIHRDELGVSKSFAFVRFTHANDAATALSKLSGYELMGKPLRMGYITPEGNMSSTGSSTAGSANWKLDDDDGGGMQMNAHSRAMLMNKLGQAAGITMPKPLLPPPVASNLPPIVGALTRCFKIKNMFDPASETEPGWDIEVKEDVTEECSKFGPVEHCYVESKKPGGIVFVRFTNTDASKSAAASLNGRYFAGRQISIEYIDPAKYSTLF